jgi:hypothetical protein
MKRSPTIAVTAMTVISLLLGACSVSTDLSADRSAGSPNTTELAPFDPSSPKGNRTAPADALTDEQLAGMLVTADDLPFDWIDDENTDDTPDPEPGDEGWDCVDAIDRLGSTLASAQASFATFDQGAYFYEGLTQYEDAETTFNEIADTLDDCTEVSFPDDGDQILGTIEPMPFYEYGDDSAAWRLTFPSGRTTIDYDLLTVRYGDLVVFFAYAGLHPIDEEEFDGLVLIAEQKLFDQLDPGAGTPTDPDAERRTDPRFDPNAPSSPADEDVQSA